MVDESTQDDEEDWMKYANSGFGSTDYSLWDDDSESEVEEQHLDEPEQLEEHTEEIPRAPLSCRIETFAKNGHMQSVSRTSRRQTFLSAN